MYGYFDGYDTLWFQYTIVWFSVQVSAVFYVEDEAELQWLKTR